MKYLIFGSSCHSGQYETITANWLALDNDISRIPKITHTWLVAANIHYGLFSKPIESLPHLEDFEAPIVKGSSPAKVIEMSTSLSPANNSSGCFFGFVKCSPCLKATQVPTSGSVKGFPPLIEIKGPLQPLVDGTICPLLSIIGFTGNGNSEQSQFNCIL